MRTIKFRGKDKHGEWQEGYLLVQLGLHYILTPIWETYRHKYVQTDRSEKHRVDAYSVGQFTGLLDMNGNEIYEGDILKVYYYGKSKMFGVVRFDKACFYIDDDFMRDEHEVKGPMTNLFSKYQFEVIGNIHDNPELISTPDSGVR